MGVSANDAQVVYVGDGTTTIFPITFPFRVGTVRARVDNVETGVLVSGTDATISPAPASGVSVVVYRDTPVVQDSEYEDNETILGSTLETSLDRGVLIDQERSRDQTRVIRAPLGETLSDLPNAADRAGMILSFDATTGDIEADQTYDQFVTDLVSQLTDPDLIDALEAAGAAQIALVEAEGAEQVALVTAAIGTAEADIAAAGETQVALIEAAGEAAAADYFTTDAAGLAAVGDQAYFGVQQTYGKGLDWKIDNSGAALFKGFGAGPLGADIRAIRLAQLSSLQCTQFPPGWDVWWAMDAELTDRAYIPYRTPRLDLGVYRRNFNTFGMGDIRDESPTTPTITPYAVNGPCGALTGSTVVFTSTATVLGITNTETFKPANGAAIKTRVTMATASGTGSKNYRIGQAGTVNVNYKIIAVPDESAEDFTDPTNADITFEFSLTFDSSKQLGIWPDTNGDAATTRIGSIECVPADTALPLLADREWGGFVSRGTASPGGVVLDSEYCFTNAGLSDPGLIDFPHVWPENIDYSDGKTEVVLAEFVGGAGSSAYAILSSEDYNADLSPITNSNTFGLLFNNTTEEGQFAPYPSYNLSRHGANGNGLGLVPYWNRYGPDAHDYGIGGARLSDRTPTFTAWDGRAERMGSYNSTKDITQVSQTNRMRIAAKARKSGYASDAELAQVIRAMQEQAAVAGLEPGALFDWIGVVGDSNADRVSGSGGTWPFRMTAAGFMGVGRQNCLLDVRSTGGKGLWSTTGLDWVVDTAANGFVDQLEQLKPGIEWALRFGLKPAIMIFGGTNDDDEIKTDPDRADDEYSQYLRDVVLAEGAALLTSDILPCQSRFTEPQNLAWRVKQKAYATANPTQAWHYDSGNLGVWNVANQASYFLSEGGDFVHLDPATGDLPVAEALRDGLVNVWRDERA